jgi:CheY-like chemotaxis protein
MFPKALILIVENEPITALDIAATIRDTGGTVLGPADSVREALKLLRADHVDGAILDCNLRDGEITPLAEVLIEQRVPLVLHTGDEMPASLQRQSPHLPLFRKPTAPLTLARKLAQRIHEERQWRLMPASGSEPVGDNNLDLPGSSDQPTNDRRERGDLQKRGLL